MKYCTPAFFVESADFRWSIGCQPTVGSLWQYLHIKHDLKEKQIITSVNFLNLFIHFKITFNTPDLYSSFSLKSILSQSQDKALRRIGELREVISFISHLCRIFFCLAFDGFIHKILSITAQGILLLLFFCLYGVTPLSCFHSAANCCTLKTEQCITNWTTPLVHCEIGRSVCGSCGIAGPSHRCSCAICCPSITDKY